MAGGVDAAALARAEAAAVGVSAVSVVPALIRASNSGKLMDLRGRIGKISLRLGAAELSRGGIVRPGGLLGRVKGSEPHSALLVGIPDLRRIPSPRPLPHSPVMHRILSGGGSADSGGRILRRHYTNNKIKPLETFLLSNLLVPNEIKEGEMVGWG